jgi:hypothetical protein
MLRAYQDPKGLSTIEWSPRLTSRVMLELDVQEELYTSVSGR